jgi:hypothetical protein
MTSKEALGVMDGVIARSTNLPVSYLVVNEALNALHGALAKLDEFEAVVSPKEAEVENLREKEVTV